jgi:hypothetical protein
MSAPVAEAKQSGKRQPVCELRCFRAARLSNRGGEAGTPGRGRRGSKAGHDCMGTVTTITTINPKSHPAATSLG